MRSATLFLLILVAPLLQVAAQQQSPPSRWLTPDSTTIARLRNRVQGRKRVRVLVNETRVELAYPVLDEVGIRPGRAPDAPAVAWGDVSRLQVRTSAFSRGLVIGGIVGAASGLIAGLSMTSACDAWLDLFCGADAGDVAAMTAGGALASALLGGLIALPMGRWSTVYRGNPMVTVPAVTLVPMSGGRVGIAGRMRL